MHLAAPSRYRYRTMVTSTEGSKSVYPFTLRKLAMRYFLTSLWITSYFGFLKRYSSSVIALLLLFQSLLPVIRSSHVRTMYIKMKKKDLYGYPER